jgi:hypothetical protein
MYRSTDLSHQQQATAALLAPVLPLDGQHFSRIVDDAVVH